MGDALQMLEEDRPLTILQVSTSDIGGGAGKVAFSLHKLYRKLGHESYLIVGRKKSDDPYVISISPSKFTRFVNKLARTILGWQYIYYPKSRNINRLIGKPIDVIHLHNLHGGYFDLTTLPKLTHLAPTVLMLHDCWTFTGHCAYPFGCERWKVGCGDCPDLKIHPSIKVDGTRFNWRRKRHLLTSSRLWITAPSNWLLKMVKESFLSKFPQRLIYNGVNLDTFSPGSKNEARDKLGIPLDRKIILFLGNAWTRDPRKGFSMLAKAFISLLRSKERGMKRPLLVVVGGHPDGEVWGIPRDCIRSVGYIQNENILAQFYRAADVLAYPTKADNCPLTVLEALGCGLPVVATRIGGIPEIVEHGKTGLIVEPNDVKGLEKSLRYILENSKEAKKMGQNARKVAEKKFNIYRQAQMYIEWYKQLISEFDKR